MRRTVVAEYPSRPLPARIVSTMTAVPRARPHRQAQSCRCLVGLGRATRWNRISGRARDQRNRKARPISRIPGITEFGAPTPHVRVPIRIAGLRGGTWN